jgi:alpha-glucoside transport system substrate-binding protein
MIIKKSHWFLIGVLVVVALVIGACATSTPEPTEAPAEPTTAPEPTEVMAETEEPMAETDYAVIPGGFLEQALAGEFSGTTVTLDGPFVDPDTVFLEQSMAAFEDATGITVNYIGDKELYAPG